jgi:hypothetical protein
VPEAGVGCDGDASPQAPTEAPTGPGEDRPLLMVDIDGVVSLFWAGEEAGSGTGAYADARPDGIFRAIDGIPHFLSSTAATHLLSLAEAYDLVWCSGWEEKAEEYLPHLLGLPAGLPFLRFERGRGAGRSIDGHWKLDAIDAYAGGRALAWIDDAFDESCHAWAAERPAPTLLVQTDPARGLIAEESSLLEAWARERKPSPART